MAEDRACRHAGVSRPDGQRGLQVAAHPCRRSRRPPGARGVPARDSSAAAPAKAALGSTPSGATAITPRSRRPARRRSRRPVRARPRRRTPPRGGVAVEAHLDQAVQRRARPPWRPGRAPLTSATRSTECTRSAYRSHRPRLVRSAAARRSASAGRGRRTRRLRRGLLVPVLAHVDVTPSVRQHRTSRPGKVLVTTTRRHSRPDRARRRSQARAIRRRTAASREPARRSEAVVRRGHLRQPSLEEVAARPGRRRRQAGRADGRAGPVGQVDRRGTTTGSGGVLVPLDRTASSGVGSASADRDAGDAAPGRACADRGGTTCAAAAAHRAVGPVRTATSRAPARVPRPGRARGRPGAGSAPRRRTRRR